MCDTQDLVLKTRMKINVFKNARISDLIGLVCCKYVNEKRKPPLK